MIFLDQYFLVKRTPRTWVQTESCIAENNCHVKWIALFSSWMCWYLNLPADTTGNVLWFFQEVLFPKKLSFLSTVLLLYLIIAKWLRSTRVPKGRVCNRVPKALQQRMPLRQARARDLLSHRPCRQRGEHWSPDMGSGLLQGTQQVSGRSGNRARPLSFLINCVSSIMWCSQLDLGGYCVGSIVELLHSMPQAYALADLRYCNM